MQIRKIVFVSEENTFTSPVAEAIARDKYKISKIELESRGMVVLFPEPPNPKGVTIAKSRGVNMDSHKAKAIEKTLFAPDVLVLTMTEKTKNTIYESFDTAVNVYTIKEYVGMDGDLDTPYGKGLKEYGECYNQIEELVEKVLWKLELLTNNE